MRKYFMNLGWSLYFLGRQGSGKVTAIGKITGQGRPALVKLMKKLRKGQELLLRFVRNCFIMGKNGIGGDTRG